MPTNKKSNAGRPKKEPTTIIAVPVSMIPLVEKILKRDNIAADQTPTVKVRVPTAQADKIRERIKKGR